MKYNRLILGLIIILTAIGQLLSSQTISETRKLQKSFPVTADMKLEVTNKYGKVHVSPARNDSVSILIEIEAGASNSSKLRRIIDGVSFDLTSTSYVVIAKSNFEKGPVSFLESIKNLTNNLISSESTLEINYFISAPSYLKINIDNRYGDIFIESMDNDFSIKLSNGSLDAEDLFGETTFNLDFFDATINSLRKSNLKVSYGDLNIKTIGEGDITSIASKIDIGTIKTLIFNSKRDRYYIGELTEIEGESYFTDFNFGIVDREMNIISRYGSLRIEEMGKTLSLASIESNYTNVYINTCSGCSFNYDIRVANCPITIPDTWILEERALSEDRDEYLYFGSNGAENPSSKIIIDMTRGKLFFDQK